MSSFNELLSSFHDMGGLSIGQFVKYFVLFVVFVVSLIFSVKIYKLPSMKRFFHRAEWKVQTARSRGHIIRGTLVNSHRNDYRQEVVNHNTDTVMGYEYHTEYTAVYEYTLDGKIKKYKTRMSCTPPGMINLLYMKSPRRLFTDEENRSDFVSGFARLIITAFPFAMGVCAALLLGFSE